MKAAAVFAAVVLGAAAISTAQALTHIADKSAVDKIIERLGAEDSVDRDRASFDLEYLPDRDISALKAAADGDKLDPEARIRLERALPRMQARARLNAKWAPARASADACRLTLLLRAYDSDGHTNPAWDESARTFLEISSHSETSVADPVQTAARRMELLAKLMAAGCDDPTILAYRGLVAADKHEPDQAVFDDFEKAYAVAEKGKCDPFTKIIIDGRIIRGHFAGFGGGATGDMLTECKRIWQEMVDQYQQVAKTNKIDAKLLREVMENMTNTGRAGKMESGKLFAEVYPPLEAAFPSDSPVACMKGAFYINYAWEARGSGWANTVTPKGWQDFEDRLQTANDALTKAYDLDHDNPDPSMLMITVALGMNLDRPVMEKWFDRAMAADPDNYKACTTKLYYLEPKWHGDAAAMLQFGHQCFDAGNWRSDIPFILVDAHESLSAYEKDRRTYFTGGDVWADINSVYSTYLRMNPDGNIVRSKYAYYACTCQQWKIANEQFNLLGDKAVRGLFQTDADMEQYRKYAAQFGR